MTCINKYLKWTGISIIGLLVVYLMISYWFISFLLILALVLLVVQTVLAKKYHFRNRLSLYLVLTMCFWLSATLVVSQLHIPKVVVVHRLFQTTKKATDTKQENELAKTTDTLETRLKNAWQPILTEQKNPVSIAIWADGQLITDQNSNEHFYTASIVKVAVATLLLHTIRENGETLDEDDLEPLRSMIEDSDNEDTTYLLDEKAGGLTALQAMFDTLNMNDTKVDEESWGLTQTTASDQIKLLRTVFETSDYLTKDEQAQIQELMRNVSDEQRFGIGTLSENVALKNGWLNDEKEDGSETWIVNSIGQVPSNDTPYLVAILSADNDTMESGENLLASLAAASNNVLNSK